MISIEKSVSLPLIERFHELLREENEITLRIPTSLDYGGAFGVPASLIQFFAAWSRENNKHIKLYSSKNPDLTLRDLSQEPHGMAALYFASDIIDKDDKFVSTREGLMHVIPNIKAMQASNYRDTMHGRGVFLVCFSGAKNEYITPFYSRGEPNSLRGRDDFEILTRQIITTSAPIAGHTLNDQAFSSISNLIYELFRNTDEHAQTDEQGNIYPRNVRGVMAKFISLNKEDEKDSTERHHAMFMLRNRLNRKLHSDKQNKKKFPETMAFLELTVFDTGPGLAKRWLSKTNCSSNLRELDIEDETQLVKNCFKRHATTKNSTSSGHGLDLVIDVLTEVKAFLRLRTGRVCLYQDFGYFQAQEFSPLHWNKEQPMMEETAGAVYSIIIPLSRSF